MTSTNIKVKVGHSPYTICKLNICMILAGGFLFFFIPCFQFFLKFQCFEFVKKDLTLKISCNQTMVDWDLGRPCSWDFLIFFYYLFPLFERASRTFCQHLTCHIWRDNEYVVIAQNFRELLNFC